MTYAQLVAAVTDYTQNTFDTTTINVMIQQAEQRIYNTVQIANLRKNVTGVLTNGNKYLAVQMIFYQRTALLFTRLTLQLLRERSVKRQLLLQVQLVLLWVNR